MTEKKRKKKGRAATCAAAARTEMRLDMSTRDRRLPQRPAVKKDAEQ